MVTPRTTKQSQLRGTNQQQLLQQRRKLEESRKAEIVNIQKAPEKRTIEQINKDLEQADAKLKEYQELKKYYDEKKNYSAADRAQEYINAWGDVKQDIKAGNIDFATAAVSASNIVSYESQKAEIAKQKQAYNKQIADLQAQAKEGKIELVRDRAGNITGYREVQKVSEVIKEQPQELTGKIIKAGEGEYGAPIIKPSETFNVRGGQVVQVVGEKTGVTTTGQVIQNFSPSLIKIPTGNIQQEITKLESVPSVIYKEQTDTIKGVPVYTTKVQEATGQIRDATQDEIDYYKEQTKSALQTPQQDILGRYQAIQDLRAGYEKAVQPIRDVSGKIQEVVINPILENIESAPVTEFVQETINKAYESLPKEIKDSITSVVSSPFYQVLTGETLRQATDGKLLALEVDISGGGRFDEIGGIFKKKKKSQSLLQTSKFADILEEDKAIIYNRIKSKLANELSSKTDLDEQLKYLAKLSEGVKTDADKLVFRNLISELKNEGLFKDRIITIGKTYEIVKPTTNTIFSGLQSFSKGIVLAGLFNPLSTKELSASKINTNLNQRYSLTGKVTEQRAIRINNRANELDRIDNLRAQKQNIVSERIAISNDRRILRQLVAQSKLAVNRGRRTEMLNQIKEQYQKVTQRQNNFLQSKQSYKESLKQRILQRQLDISKQKTNQQERQQQRQLQKQLQRQFSKQKQSQRQAQPQLQLQKQKQLQRQKQKQQQRQRQRLRQKQLQIKTPKLKFPGSEIFGKKKIKSSFELKPRGKWDAVVKRGNKFVTINKKPFAKKAEARDYGSHYVGTTLRATFKPVPSTRKGVQKLPKDMRGHFFRNSLSYRPGKSKLTMRAFVEIPKARLNTPTEKAELKRARAFAKRKKR